MIAGSYDENILSPAPNTKGQSRREQGRKRRHKRKNADFLLTSEETGHCQDHGSSSTFHPRATKRRPKDPNTKGQGCREPDRERGRKRKRSGTGDAQNQTARPESNTRAEPCAIPEAPDPKVQCQRPENFSQDCHDVSLEDQSTCHLGSEEPMSDDMAPNLASLEELYFKGPLLGKGGYGSVYMGTRISDGLPVAIKYVAKTGGDSGVLPVEVALMKQVNMAPRCPYILSMLDWFDHPTQYVMVLERPMPCKDLLDFLEDSEGTLPEWLARKVMVQLVQALDHCQKRGVLHRDVKPDNILIQIDSHQVKLFDFGCGDVWKDTAYKDFAGTPDYTAPEWSFMREYLAGPITVWSVGITLFLLVCGSFPFTTSLEAIRGRVAFPAGVSQATCFHSLSRIPDQCGAQHAWLMKDNLCLSNQSQQGAKRASCYQANLGSVLNIAVYASRISVSVVCDQVNCDFHVSQCYGHRSMSDDDVDEPSSIVKPHC